MYSFFKPLLFALSPETAHRITFQLLDFVTPFSPARWFMRTMFCLPDKRLEKAVLGLVFPNPVGLAAGFDKNGTHISGMGCLGFGFIEVGTVTPLAQEGNPKPRLFRLPKDQALINRMGFNNAGIDALVKSLQKFRQNNPGNTLIIGGNIGKNKLTPNEAAAQDYLICFEKLFPWVDYFVVNVSSPNTPGLRELQEKEPLTRLLNELQVQNRLKAISKPILLKIAPDLTNSQLDDIAEIVQHTALAGVIATNTTVSRSGLKTSDTQIEAMGMGGLSGTPVCERATEVIRYLRKKLDKNVVIIGVGGIDSASSAQEKLDAGADLVQLYTGLIYKGPGLVKQILKGIAL